MPTTATDPVDLVFRSFADRTRLRILNLLRLSDELCVCDIVSVLELPQAKTSRHLAYLRRAGLVAARKDGTWAHYRLAPARGLFHQRMLDCLHCCMAEVPELKRDAAALSGRIAAGRGCC